MKNWEKEYENWRDEPHVGGDNPDEETDRETRHYDCPFCGKQWREYCDDDKLP